LKKGPDLAGDAFWFLRVDKNKVNRTTSV